MNLHSIFGLNLQRLRRKRGYSQERLAYLAACSRAYLSGAEAGHRNATLETIDKLARALEVDPAELFRRPGDASK